jgi:transposase, IS30 family
VAKRFWRLPEDLRREVIRLAAEHRTQREIVELTGVAKGSVWRVLRPRGGVSRSEDRQVLDRPDRLNLDDRIRIAVGLGVGESFTAIAAAIGRHVSTVSREVGGRTGRATYRAEVAHRAACARRGRPKITKLAGNPQLCQRVIEDLERWYSPQQIAFRLRREFPDNPEMWVSHETIYKSLFVQGRGELRKELTACLRTGRAIRRSRVTTRPRDGAIHEPVSISERPAEADDRAVPGHWEGDLIIGARGKTAVGTLVERTTRYLMLLHLSDGYSAEAVRDAMTAKIQSLPDTLRRSITWDRGTEMARHREFTIDTGIQIYFCDPHSPWQRGTNENTNGLLRQYLPKGTDLSAHSAQDLDAIADSLNDRPRKTLDWQKPTEALDTILATTG